MIRPLITFGLGLLLIPVSVLAGEPVIKVDCLCVAKEHGLVLGRSDGTPSQLGIDKLKMGSAIVLLSAEKNLCGNYPSGCTDEVYEPQTGKIRMVLENYGYMYTNDDFKLSIGGRKK